MRAFVAVPCGEQLAAALTTALDGWRAGPGGRLPVRWTRPETWHLTLQFLGDWPESRLRQLESDLAATVRQEVFVMIPGGLGGFPNLKAPRVLFLHLADDGQAGRLAGRVRETVGRSWPNGPQDTRAFRGHLTLGRVRSRFSRDEAKLLSGLDLDDLPEVPVEGFSLVASELRSTGPRYSELAFFPLRK